SLNSSGFLGWPSLEGQNLNRRTAWYTHLMRRTIPTSKGPFLADQIGSGDPYELSNGHAILCRPPGGRGSRANLLGGLVLGSDPAVEEAGIDTGYSPSSDTLRAPDVAVGNVPNTP